MGWFNHQLVFVEFPSFTKHSAATKSNDPVAKSEGSVMWRKHKWPANHVGEFPDVSKCLVTLQGGPIGSDGYNPYK